MKNRKIILIVMWGINMMCSFLIVLYFVGIKLVPSTLSTVFPWVAGFFISNISLVIFSYFYASDLDRETIWWAILTLLFPCVTPIFLLFTPPRKKWTSNGYLWRCPECGEIMQKDNKELWDVFMTSGTIPIGTGSCENCGVELSQYDVYRGKYDI